jgi:acetyl-CoA/propionyl-CoA carboxylase biotin carboxyl carrier protein
LQVEHPVTEEVSGIDLVREMFRLARGEDLGYDDPPVRGHAIEFRINCEDPGRNFLPEPGTVTAFVPASGPGVRLDAGVETGTVIGPAWDSLLAKLIVTGSTREQALRRAARALAEFRVDGLATTLPFHRRVVADPAFHTMSVHTRWIETEFVNDIPPITVDHSSIVDTRPRETVVVEIGGRRLEVSLPALRAAATPATNGTPAARARMVTRNKVASGDALVSPMHGTVVTVKVENGQQVEAGDLIVVLEAMKMEQPLTAHRSGVIHDLNAEVGAAVVAGAALCRIT